MNIIAADDERIVLQALVETIEEALPDANVQGFGKGSDAVEFARNNFCEIAFLDIQMCDMNGIVLAKKLKEINPKINIIFVTGYTEYAGEALSLYVSGYVLKPATKKTILRELENLRHPILASSQYRMRVQTFGDFEVFVDNEPLYFASAKAKELFALLVDRLGAGLTTPQIAAVLWEEEPYTTYQKNRVQQVIAQLRGVLQKAGCEDVLYKKRNQTAVRTDGFFCDYYEFLKGSVQIVNSFSGKYMAQYSWAEFTIGSLYDKK